ncbi:MAG: hypothetical protein IT282_03205 [Bacteroidetes bacterium]|nr:hypothetical protein [Bacteroidota bacterium]
MKMAFVVANDVYFPRLLAILGTLGIDYYTRWDKVTGKGHGTEPHLGTRSFPGHNSVLMIAFSEPELLEKLIVEIIAANKEILRADDKFRLFQVPLERIV